jgi:hypothetical protein
MSLEHLARPTDWGGLAIHLNTEEGGCICVPPDFQFHRSFRMGALPLTFAVG